MPLQTWDIVVHGRPHRVEIDRNPETGKHFVRVDGRMALKPFSDSSGEFRVEIDGKPYLLRVAGGTFDLEDKGSRYHDTSAARAEGISGQITISRGLEHITVVADDGLVRIERLAEGLKAAVGGGGLLGALVSEAGFQLAQKLANRLGEVNFDRSFRTFSELPSEVWCRLEHLPLDLVTLFSDEAEPGSRVLVIPRQAVRRVTSARNRILVETDATRASEAKPYKFDVLTDMQTVLDQLCAAGYALGDEDMTRAGADARDERARRRAEAAEQPPPPPPAERPAAKSAVLPAVQTPRIYSGVAEVRWTAPLVTVIGRDPVFGTEMNDDAKAIASVYPKARTRRVNVEPPLRDLGRERYDIVHLLGTFDDKTRFREVGGFAVSLKDLIVQLVDHRVRMLWLASANDPGPASETLRWVAGLNFFLVFTTAREDDYTSMLAEALERLAAGEPLSSINPELEAAYASRWRLVGGGEAVFLPQ